MDDVKMALLDLENGRFKDDRDAALLFLLREREGLMEAAEDDGVIDSLEEQLNDALGDATQAENTLQKFKDSVQELLNA